MADLGSSIVSSIKWYHSLQNIIVSVNQQIKYMNNAWKLKNDYGYVHEKSDSVLPILGVWGLENGCNRLLAMSGRQWKCLETLNHPATKISVFKFW